ncbi:veA protein [Seiridium cupressi]
MSEPLNSWAPQPARPRYYPQELPGPGLRLPPLSSAVVGRHSSEAPLPKTNDANDSRQAYQSHRGSYSAAPSNHHASSQSPVPTGGPYATANSSPGYPENISNRPSPAYPPAMQSRAEGSPELQRGYVPARGQPSYQGHQYQPQPPVRPGYEQRPGLPQSSGLQLNRPMSLVTNRGPQTEQSLPSLPSPNQAASPRSDVRPPERMRISDLLSNEQGSSSRNQSQARTTPLQSPATPAIRFQYTANIRQQPFAARSCGFGERDRRVIDPPPIVELKIDDPRATPEEVRDGLRVPFAVMHCTIWNEAGDQDISFMPEEYRQQRRLMGTTVSSPFNGRDERGIEGCFFCFPDLSVRTAGAFRLKFVLVMVDPMVNFIGTRHPVRAQAMSNVFTVYSAKDFPGMQASTPLTKKLKEQGCLISIKKGNERGGRGGRDDSDDDDIDEEDGDAGGSTSARRKKQRK